MSETHPAWPIIRLFVALGFLTLILWLNASNFDKTELRAIAWTAIALAGSESFPKVLSRFTK